MAELLHPKRGVAQKLDFPTLKLLNATLVYAAEIPGSVPPCEGPDISATLE